MRYSWGVVSVGAIEGGRGTEERVRDAAGAYTRLQHTRPQTPPPASRICVRPRARSAQLAAPPRKFSFPAAVPSPQRIGISNAVCEVRTRVALRLTE